MATLNNARNANKDAVFFINLVIVTPGGAEIKVRSGVPITDYYGADKALVEKFKGASNLEDIQLTLKGTVRSAAIAETHIEGDLWAAPEASEEDPETSE